LIMIAAIAPPSLAFHIHQIQPVFHKIKVKLLKSIRFIELLLLDSLLSFSSSNNGTNAKKDKGKKPIGS
jgi:hypothetical protein